MKFKILKIIAKNFKAFKEINFDCLGGDAIILGGKNGYGKTTLFDIVELTLTGQIKRYKDYAELYTDKRIQREGKDKPLVNNTQTNEVFVQVEILLGLTKYRFTRIASTSSINHLLRFDCFSNLIIEKFVDNEWENATDDLDANSCIKEIKDNYSRYYYISQEETLDYLKTKEKDRPAILQNLFDISFFEDKLSAIKRFQDSLKERIETLKTKKTQLSTQLNNLTTNLPDTNSVIYEQLAKDVNLPWDAKYFQDTFDFQGTLAPSGTIENLLYFAKNIEYYNQYQKYLSLKKIEEKKEDIVLWFQYRKLEKEIDNYKLFRANCINPVNQLTLDTISSFSFEKFDQGDSKIKNLESELSLLKISNQTFNGLQRAYGRIDEIKSLITPYITVESNIHKCPMCGHDYKNALTLINALKNYTFEDQDTNDSIHENLAQKILSFKEKIQTEIITPKLDLYKKMGISDDVINKLDKIPESLKRYADLIFTDFQLNLDAIDSYEGKLNIINNFISTNTVDLNSSIDYNRLINTYTNVAHFISNDKLTIGHITNKRQYIINQWHITNNQKKNQLSTQLNLCTKQLANAVNYDNRIKKAKKNLDDSKKKYLGKIINDVKILFYIYSGRIMQDCFYGRGLFLIYNTEKNYVNFTSNPKSGVDALYNLSSGQLIALILSFTLSLNKLYRKNNFMLIDDPIQCIDDINMWGFLETLRHEFQDYSFILSTHESQYGSLLRYRLDKFGFNAQYRDLFKEGNRG